MSESFAQVIETVENCDMDSFLAARTKSLASEPTGLGLHDTIVTEKFYERKGLLSTVLGNIPTQIYHHSVLGLHIDAPYICSHVHSLLCTQEPAPITYRGEYRIGKVVVCIYNPISRVDLRVIIQVPGSTSFQAVHVDSLEVSEPTDQQWKEASIASFCRKSMPHDVYSAELLYYGYKYEAQLVKLIKDNIQDLVKIGQWKKEDQVVDCNHPVFTYLYRYFSNSFRISAALEVFYSISKTYPAANVYIFKLYQSINRPKEAFKFLLDNMLDIGDEYIYLKAFVGSALLDHHGALLNQQYRLKKERAQKEEEEGQKEEEVGQKDGAEVTQKEEEENLQQQEEEGQKEEEVGQKDGAEVTQKAEEEGQKDDSLEISDCFEKAFAIAQSLFSNNFHRNSLFITLFLSKTLCLIGKPEKALVLLNNVKLDQLELGLFDDFSPFYSNLIEINVDDVNLTSPSSISSPIKLYSDLIGEIKLHRESESVMSFELKSHQRAIFDNLIKLIHSLGLVGFKSLLESVFTGFDLDLIEVSQSETPKTDEEKLFDYSQFDLDFEHDLPISPSKMLKYVISTVLHDIKIYNDWRVEECGRREAYDHTISERAQNSDGIGSGQLNSKDLGALTLDQNSLDLWLERANVSLRLSYFNEAVFGYRTCTGLAFSLYSWLQLARVFAHTLHLKETLICLNVAIKKYFRINEDTSPADVVDLVGSMPFELKRPFLKLVSSVGLQAVRDAMFEISDLSPFFSDLAHEIVRYKCIGFDC
ncbi:hypothetical protein P9112_010635 [Eukaryota sp. TZLM1-RC]